MRRTSAAKHHAAFLVRPDHFAWSEATLAVLRHSTLPWFGEEAAEVALSGVPLSATTSWGARDRMSLLAQLAAHQAFLRFAAVDDGEFDPAQWIAVRERGTDARLVRIASPASSSAEAGVVEAAAAMLGVERLSTLEKLWCKPEEVYMEIGGRLSTTAADCRWLRRAAAGSIRAPGPLALSEMTSRRRAVMISSDPGVFESAELIGRMRGDALFTLRGSSLLSRLSTCGPLLQSFGASDSVSEGEAAETFASLHRGRTVVIVVREAAMVDSASRRLLRLIAELHDDTRWYVDSGDLLPHGDAVTAANEHFFLVAPRVSALRSFQQELTQLPLQQRSAAVEDLILSDRYDAFLATGKVSFSSDQFLRLREPQRSYLSALALVGTAVPLATAQSYLKAIGCDAPIESLVLDGVSRIDDTAFLFIDEAMHTLLSEQVPGDAKRGLAAVAASSAAESLHSADTARLWLLAGDSDRALASLSAIGRDDRDAVPRLNRLPQDLTRRSPDVSLLLASSLCEQGRYEDARSMISEADCDAARSLHARIDRRLGRYRAALETLSTMAVLSSADWCLRGELQRLTNDYATAAESLATAASLARTRGDAMACEFERRLLAIDRGSSPAVAEASVGSPYLDARLVSYAAGARGDYRVAIDAATEAAAHAKTLPEEIDARLDLLFAAFASGDWNAARAEARRCLAAIEETQGDRAAGGVLFTLAYLCAEVGQTAEARRHVDRLRQFYAASEDRQREKELDLLSAQIALAEFRFADAGRAACSVADNAPAKLIREAAAVILCELQWLGEFAGPVPDVTGFVCSELACRYDAFQMFSAGRYLDSSGDFASLGNIADAWTRERRLVESAGVSIDERRYLRFLLGLRRRSPGAQLEVEIARRATALGVSVTSADRGEVGSHELQILQAFSVAAYPFRGDSFALPSSTDWRLVSRNRLGRWTQQGSTADLTDSELEQLTSQTAPDWLQCDDREWLYVSGLSSWSAASRDAVGAVVQAKSEAYRLRRLVEQDAAPAAPPLVDGIIGNSPGIVQMLSTIRVIAPTDVAVCIEGESGTGKELVARAIHQNSARRHRKFTPVNCAALPESLIESELFGHVRGAFTGADRDRMGLIEASDGGTLFLDEVGELPLTAQAKLLRFLQEGEIRRVGDTATRQADVRIVAATNRTLEAAVDAGTFREDLYYRLRGVDLTVPPLRERGSDVLLLARAVIQKEHARTGTGPDRLSDEVEILFTSYRWPGNVRELQNTVRAAHALAGESRAVMLEHLPARLRGTLVTRKPGGRFHDELFHFRRSLVESALTESSGNQNRAARLLGMSRQALAYQIKELGVMVR